MFVSAIHRISDPDAFWATAASAAKDTPADTKLHLLEPLFGGVCKNEYLPIDASISMGLPTAAV